MNPFVMLCSLIRSEFILLFKGPHALEHENAALRRLVHWKHIRLEREDPEKAREVAALFSGAKHPKKKKSKKQKPPKRG